MIQVALVCIKLFRLDESNGFAIIVLTFIIIALQLMPLWPRLLMDMRK